MELLIAIIDNSDTCYSFGRMYNEQGSAQEKADFLAKKAQCKSEDITEILVIKTYPPNGDPYVDRVLAGGKDFV